MKFLTRNSVKIQPTGEHFNLPGHELCHLKVSVLEKVWDLGRSLLEVRESKYIRDFMTELREMNRKNSFYLIVNCDSASFLKKRVLFMFNSLKSLNNPP